MLLSDRYKGLRGQNRLLVNKGPDKNGIPVFREEAASYGLDFSGFSTQATFFDHDADGDLDLFLLNHSGNHDGNYMPRAQIEGTFDSLAGQRLYTCETDRDDAGNLRIRYRDVSRSAGIRSTRIGYGLGVVVTDVDRECRTDIYVGIDFHDNDYPYLTWGHGNFCEAASDGCATSQHTWMGCDWAVMHD